MSATNVIWCLCVLLPYCIAKDIHFFVDPNGADTNNGLDINHPVKTLAKAVALASSSAYSGNNLFIELLPGYHDLESKLHIGQHHGKLLTIRSYNGQEAHVTGGRRIPASNFKRVTDSNILNALPKASHQFVRAVNLRSLNITNYGSIGKYGFYSKRSAPLEVFHNGNPLRLARWPNQGFININGIPDGKDGLRFAYNSTRPSTWRHLDDLWVYGYWYWSWADRTANVANLDSAHMMVTLNSSTPPLYGLRLGNWGRPQLPGYLTQGGYFRFINVLSELDESGEYYMDKSTGVLYTWMPTPDGSVHSSDVIYVSMIKTCIELQYGLKNVVFSNFVLEACRERGILGYHLRNIQVKRMEIRNTGNFGIYFSGDSRNCYISRTVVHDGDGGITVEGGNRKLLESGGNVVEDCEIYRYSREGAVGMNAVTLSGVGNLVRYNNMYIGQYTAVRYSGNDHVIEHNHVYNTCMNSSDCGAIHTGRDWTYRGNKIRYNIVHHTLRLVPGADNRGIMLDDQASSVTISNNVFYDNEVHVNIGGGRDNIITNNIMYNATKSSMQVDGRGVVGHSNDNTLIKGLHNMPYTGTLWSQRYPKLAEIDSHNKSLPEGNQITKNIIYNEPNKKFINGYSGWLSNSRLFNVTENGFSYGPVDHFDVDNHDFRVKCHAKDWADYVNFQQVLTINDVGPRFDVGPDFHKRVHKTTWLSGSSHICSTLAPATTSPMPSFVPDGAGQKPLFNVTNEGCWLHVAACSNHPEAVGTYRDIYGEQHENSLDNETMCFRRAVAEWKWCGSKPNEEVAAIYGPTGATTFAGDGCFMAMFGCPKHSGPADGHVVSGFIYRDTWAEQHINAAHDEAKCLSRAIAQWRYCGSHPNHPVTSIYRPTGAKASAGAGCWLHVQKCPRDPIVHTVFYDAFGATNVHSDDSESACFSRAEDYWIHCGGDARYPVSAEYRPSARTRTYPGNI